MKPKFDTTNNVYYCHCILHVNMRNMEINYWEASNYFATYLYYLLNYLIIEMSSKILFYI